MKLKFGLLAVALFLILTTSCKKEEGEGGSASITGYVHVTDYNASFVIVQGEYPGMDKDVYIKYGDDIGEGDRTRTGPDGRFEFKYLREGTYTLYVYSDDTTLSGTSVVSKIVEITDKKQKLDAGTFEIKKD